MPQGNLSSCNPTPVLIVPRSAAALPQTTTTPYFTVVGCVLLVQILGEVTTITANTGAIVSRLTHVSAGGTVALCTDLDIANDVVGTMYSIPGVFGSALISTTYGPIAPASMIPHPGILLPAGTINFACDASKSGATKWTLHYQAFDAGSYVVVA